MIKLALPLSSALTVALLIIGCNTTAVIPFSREQAIARANQANAALICEADERVFTYDAQTGESIGERMPNTRCAASGLLVGTATP